MLAGAAAFSLGGFTGPAFALTDERFAAAYADRGGFGVAVFDTSGRIRFRIPLSARGHGMAVSPDRSLLVVFDRRPGIGATVVDLGGARQIGVLAAPANRRFSGHGFFGRRGRVLYAVENDFEEERGVMGVYDVGGAFQRIGEIPTGGIGPHEAILLRDGRTAAVANGGIVTHPDFPRMKLNLAEMDSSLTLIDLETGDIAGHAVLPPQWYQVSLRHLAEDSAGAVWVGGQFEGPEGTLAPLLFRMNMARQLETVPLERDVLRSLNGYIGSVAAARDGKRVAVTSPRGNRLLVFGSDVPTLERAAHIVDVCGVAASASGFAVTGGAGGVRINTKNVQNDESIAWDNHLTGIQ